LFVTDGVLERVAAGVDLRAALVSSADEHRREAVQSLIQAVVDASNGKLSDDATAMCLDCHGGPPRDRTSDSGANLT